MARSRSPRTAPMSATSPSLMSSPPPVRRSIDADQHEDISGPIAQLTHARPGLLRGETARSASRHFPTEAKFLASEKVLRAGLPDLEPANAGFGDRCLSLSV